MIPVDLLMAFYNGKIIRAAEWGLTQAQLDSMLSGDITEDEWNVWEEEDEKEEQAKAA